MRASLVWILIRQIGEVRFLRLALALCLSSLFAFNLTLIEGQVERKPFRVEDSIARTTFSDPDETGINTSCKTSPDGRHFLVVTTRGILSTNQLESSIWVYDTKILRKHLRSGTAKELQPVRLWSVRGTPTLEQFHSYGSLITMATWSSNSSSILFLLEKRDKKRHLYAFRLGDQKPHLISLANQDIIDFAEANGTTAYVAHREGPNTSTADAKKTRSSIDLTRVSLFHILDSTQFPDGQSTYRPAELWVSYRGRRSRLNQEPDGRTWGYPVAAQRLFHLAVSPDGNKLIAAKPVDQINPTWRHLSSYSAQFDLEHLEMPSGDPSLDWAWPWQYVSIDLRSGSLWKIADAPSSITAGYGGRATGTWSRDSQAMALTNMFLQQDTAMTPNLSACALAVAFVVQRNTTCVAYSKYPDQKIFVESSAFGNTNQDVSLTWSNGTSEQYKLFGRQWSGHESAKVVLGTKERISLEVRQNLNQAPAVWEVDTNTGDAKEIWDPNPMMKDILWGPVSIYEWTGRDGYHWHAGLVLPPNYLSGHRYPLVIQTHGFHRGQYLVDGPYTTAFTAQALASRGIAVLQLEDRADRHLLPEDQEATAAATGFVEAIESLDKDGLIDSRHVGIIGFSRTCWYVETALEKYPAAFKAAIIADGIDQGYMSYMLFCSESIPCEDYEERANGGRPFGRGLEQWMANAVSFNTDKIQTPLHIEAIQLYSLLQEWELYSSLKQQQKIVDLKYIPDGQHILQQPWHRHASQQETVDWFVRWLLNDGDANGNRPKK